MIDLRHRVDEEVAPLVVWIGDVVQHAVVPDLWEARVGSFGELDWLWIHADPDRRWRPSKAVRQAVMEAYQADIPVAATSLAK